MLVFARWADVTSHWGSKKMSLSGGPHRVKRGSTNEEYLQLGGTNCRWRCPVNRGGWRHPRAAR
jgi:hypothetical protein